MDQTRDSRRVRQPAIANRNASTSDQAFTPMMGWPTTMAISATNVVTPAMKKQTPAPCFAAEIAEAAVSTLGQRPFWFLGFDVDCGTAVITAGVGCEADTLGGTVAG